MEKYRNFRRNCSEQSREIEAGQTAYHREASRLESLRNITERYDGYGNSIRRVMEQKAKEPGIRGVVADIIHVQKDYEVAIETALGGSIQNIVTDNEQTAKRMIEFPEAEPLWPCDLPSTVEYQRKRRLYTKRCAEGTGSDRNGEHTGPGRCRIQ